MATLEERKTEYNTHKNAGYDFYNSVRAQLSLDMESLSVTEEQASVIANKLKRVKDELLSGDWKSALIEVHNVLPNIHLSSTRLEDIKTEIQDYITNNYTW